MSKDTIFSDAPIKKMVKETQRRSTISASIFDRPLIDLTQYELLIPGDILEKGDEYYYFRDHSWYETTCDGQRVTDDEFYRRRRNIR